MTLRPPENILNQGPVAQWIERPPPKRQVGCSIQPRIIAVEIFEKKHYKYPMKQYGVFFLICSMLLLVSCREPQPLFGTWADNRGNVVSFFDDNSFNVRIYSLGVTTNYEGNFTVLQNSLTFNCTNIDLRVVTEWDIRGNMLYLDWPREDGLSSSLTLYKISN